MAKQVLEARIRQKTDTLANWEDNELVLLGGEQAFILNEDGTPVNFRIGDGTKTFAQLPNWIAYDQAAYSKVTGTTLPESDGQVHYTILGGGTYTQTSGANVVIPAGSLGIVSNNGTTWSVDSVITLPEGNVPLSGEPGQSTDVASTQKFVTDRTDRGSINITETRVVSGSEVFKSVSGGANITPAIYQENKTYSNTGIADSQVYNLYKFKVYRGQQLTVSMRSNPSPTGLIYLVDENDVYISLLQVGTNSAFNTYTVTIPQDAWVILNNRYRATTGTAPYNDPIAVISLTSTFENIANIPNPLRTNLSLTDRWDGAILLTDGSTRDGFYNISNVTYTKEANIYFPTSAAPYAGFQVRVNTTINNFFYFFQKDRFVSDPLYTGNIWVTVELMSPVTITFAVRIYRVTTSATQIYTQNVTLTANIPQTVSLPSFSLMGTETPANVRGFQLRFNNIPAITTPIYIGRIAATTFNNAGQPEVREDYNRLVHESSEEGAIQLKNIQDVGDSQANFVAPFLSSIFTNRSVRNAGVGGQKSYVVRTRFLTSPEYFDYTQVFWMGGNNRSDISAVDMVMADINTCVMAIAHYRYLVVGMMRGDYAEERKSSNSDRYKRLNEIEKQQTEVYGLHFLNMSKCIIDNFDNGVQLASSFVQPAVGSNVTITLNSTAKFIAGNTIIIGLKSIYDRYTVVSVSSATQIILQLLTSSKVASGGTVDNETQSGNTGIGYLKVWLEQDVIDINDEITPSSLRIDAIHLTNEGYTLCAKYIKDRIDILGI